MGLKIQLKERIIDCREGESYQFEVYEWKNFPLRKMLFKFTIGNATSGQTPLLIDIEYKASPAFLAFFMIGKMRKLVHDVLLGYKHFAETGGKKVPVKELRKKYRPADYVILEQA